MIRRSIARAVSSLVARPVNGAMESNFNQIIKSLFANNEQGFAYDPNDLSTMFQDAAGTIPVTGAGQAVGLMLDKSKGLALSSELKQSALAKMTGTAPVATFNTVTGIGTVNRVDISNQSFILFNGAVGSKWYKVSVTNNSAGAIQLRDATTAAVGATLAAIQPNTTFSGYVYVNSGFLLSIAASTGECGFTVNSIKELSGNHAYQTISASRPILRQNATTGAYYLEFDGVDDRLVTGSLPSMGLATTVFTGSRSNKAATAAVVARGVGGYLYQTAGSVVVQSVSKPVTILTSGNAVITVKYEGSGTGVTLKANNVSRTESTTDRGFNTSNPLVIGAFSNGGEVPLQGHIYCLIGISKLTTDAESIAIEKEIAKRLGVTLNV